MRDTHPTRPDRRARREARAMKGWRPSADDRPHYRARRDGTR